MNHAKYLLLKTHCLPSFIRLSSFLPKKGTDVVPLLLTGKTVGGQDAALSHHTTHELIMKFVSASQKRARTIKSLVNYNVNTKPYVKKSFVPTYHITAPSPT